MSITDELREWLKSLYTPNSATVKDEGERIADRIDAEHEAKVSYWQGASYKDGYDEGFASADDWLAQHEDAMAEHGWIRLPKDADNVPWSVGDRDEDGNVVTQLRLTSAGWFVITDGNWPYRPKHKRHRHHAPTVEDVLTEFGIDWEHESDCEDRAALLKEYASKLLLAEREDA